MIDRNDTTQLEHARSGRPATTHAGRDRPPLVSIVTPSYNQGRYIRETIESVLGQDYPHIEYWVIDGGSTDETLEILREFAHDPRLHWISETDGGQSDAINKGLARCTGELFGWLNSDDRLLPGAVGHVVDAWLADARSPLLYGLARLIDERGADMGYCPAQSTHMTLQRLLDLRCFLAQPATFAPAAMVRAVGGLDPALHYAMDLDLWIKIAERAPIRHVPHDLAQFRLHPSSKTVSLSPAFITDVAVVLDRAAESALLPPRRARARTQIYALRVYLMPEVADLRAAWASLRAATRTDWLVLPEGAFVLAKAFARMLLGERAWSWVRLLQVKSKI